MLSGRRFALLPCQITSMLILLSVSVYFILKVLGAPKSLQRYSSIIKSDIKMIALSDLLTDSLLQRKQRTIQKNTTKKQTNGNRQAVLFGILKYKSIELGCYL